MDDDIGAVLDGSDQVGRAEGVVHNKRQAVLMCNFRDGVKVGDVGIRVAQRFKINGLGVVLDGVLHLRQVVRVDKGGGDAVLGQRVCKQVIAAAVDGFLGDNVIAGLGQSFNGIGDGSSAGGQSQGRNAALKSCNAFFQDVLRGVGQTAVDVAGVCQTKAGGRVGGIVEHIGGRLINRHCACVCCGICLFLADMQLKGFKFIVTHKEYLFLFYIFCSDVHADNPAAVLPDCV